MIDFALLKIVGRTSFGLLVIGWLVLSFLAPGKVRSRLAWVAATFMYLALLCFFTFHFQEAFRGESVALMIAFGFLTLIFLAGLLVSGVKTVGEFIGRAPRSGPTV
jgi:uncharacterized membrane protein